MATPSKDDSQTPIESTETDQAQIKQEDSAVKDEEWRAMKTMIDNIYNHREPEYDGTNPLSFFVAARRSG